METMQYIVTFIGVFLLVLIAAAAFLQFVLKVIYVLRRNSRGG